MRKIIWITSLLISTFLLQHANAQVSVNVNIGVQPVWGPVGYSYAEYYYLPDIETYYYVPQRQFIYEEGGRWVTVSSLPARYSSFNLYSGYKVVINKPQPYLQHKTYKVKYVSYKGKRGEHVIRDSRDAKYFEIKEHPEHGKWNKAPQGKSDNGGGKQHYKSSGQGQPKSQGNNQHKSPGNSGNKGKGSHKK